MSTLHLTTPGPEHLAPIQALLELAGLPSADLSGHRLQTFVAAENGEGTLTHCAGLEIFGADALLRSVAIAAPYRSRGEGRALLARIGDEARARGVRTLYLLTTTARDFFARYGYATCARRAVPGALAQTPEFAGLCPATATCMRRSLDPDGISS